MYTVVVEMAVAVAIGSLGLGRPPCGGLHDLAVRPDTLASVVQIDGARVHGVPVGPGNTVCELDGVQIEAHDENFGDLEVRDVHGKVFRGGRVTQGA